LKLGFYIWYYLLEFLSYIGLSYSNTEQYCLIPVFCCVGFINKPLMSTFMRCFIEKRETSQMIMKKMNENL